MTTEELLKLRIRAAEAMGWTEHDSYDPCIERYIDTFVVTEDHEVCGADGRATWKPDTDLNQAWMLAERFGDPMVYRGASGTYYACIGKSGEDHVWQSNSDNRALALTLAAIQAWEAQK